MNFKDIKKAWQTAKDHGLGWTVQRVIYEGQLRTGHHKRILPSRKWRKDELSHWLKKDISTENIFQTWKESNPSFFFSHQQQTEIAQAIQQVNPNATRQLKDVNIHQLSYFSKRSYAVNYPEIWFTNPFTKPVTTCSTDKHWSDYPMYDPTYEDLKFIWEPGRFVIVYDLVRAYFLTQDESFAEQYWQLIESWIAHNPPNIGPHWKCGQETSLRLMAWYFGLFAFLDTPATTAERFEQFLMAVAVQVHRVSKDYRYSYIQQSNHAVSEGLGLYVTGVLFPQLEKAAEWQVMGKKILEERSLFLFRPDGTYFQKSHNYLRFILHAYLYVLVVAKANQDSFAQHLLDRMKAAVNYLSSVLDWESGRVPNFGSNDGALILPLNGCDFRDFRPVIAATHYYFHQTHLFENGAWQEDLIWLFGSEAVGKNIPQTITEPPSKRFDHSGIFTLRNKNSWVFTHAESIKDRPAHADALHLDVWWRGINMCCDPGTYLYYGHKPWRDAYKHTSFHNTITVDGKDQMERMYRFTWGYWHDCKLNRYEGADAIKLMELEHNGYVRLTDPVIHKRLVIGLPNDYWVVVDDLIGKTKHDIKLNWLLADFPYAALENGIELHSPKGDFVLKMLSNSNVTPQFHIHRGDAQQEVKGWRSNYYGFIEPALQLSYNQSDVLPLRLLTCFGESGWATTWDQEAQQLKFVTPEQDYLISLYSLGEEKILNIIH